ncbi:MAG: homoserine dehydrogenase [Nitrospirota bacterium]
MINVGIIGFGTIGTGVVKLLKKNADVIERRLGVPVLVKMIADIDIERDRGVTLDKEILIRDAGRVIEDDSIDIIVELIGGYNPAKEFIIKAIKKRKHVVTANKALLAVYGEEIFNEAEKMGVDIRFEGSVGGGIPILRMLREGLSADNIQSIYGIINGTCNYILTRMTAEGISFKEALKEAQRSGYAETDPTLDIEGIDSAHKLIILASMAFGTPLRFDDAYIEGISNLAPVDIRFAEEFGYTIKLLAIAKMVNGEVEVRVHPTMLPREYLISKVDGVYNAIYVVGDAVGSTLFYGQGAGEMPTGSAVVSDIIEISRGIINGVSGRVPATSFLWDRRNTLRVRKMEGVISRYYLRFSALDRPGVLSKISGVLGSNNISISSVLQKGRKEGEAVPVVMMTHEAKEQNMRAAIEELDRLPVVAEKTVFIRVEGGE